MEALPDLFRRLIPSYPHASLVKNGIYKCNRDIALTMRYIALNTKNCRKSITIDIDMLFDGEDFYEKIYEKGIPPPNYVVVSPDTKHYHLIYLLPVPVKRGSSFKAERAFRMVQENLVTAWGGDRGYANHLMKNPLHPHWITHEIRNEGYSLQELITWSVKQDFGIKPEKRRHIDESVENPKGRNCTLFDLARNYAYKNKERSYNALYSFAEERNRKGYTSTAIKEPLSEKEVSTIVESVWGFMQSYDGKGGWGQYTDEQRKKSLETRREKMWNRRRRLIEYRKMKLSLKTITDILSVSRTTINKDIKELSDPNNNIITEISNCILNILDTKLHEYGENNGKFPVIVLDTS